MNLAAILTGCECGIRPLDRYPFRHTYFAWPYLAICASLAFGEAIGFASANACVLWPMSLFLTLVIALVGYGWVVPGWRCVSIIMLGTTLAWFSESRRATVFDFCDYSSCPLTCEFKVLGRIMESESFISFDSEVGGVSVRVLCRSQKADNLIVPSIGEKWRCSGWMERRPRDDRRRRMFWVCGRGSSAVRVSEPSQFSASSRFRRLRSVLSQNIGYGLMHDPLTADLDRAIILGERAKLSKEMQQMFADAGTVHVFAISGLHVGVVAWLLVYLLMIVFCFPLRWVALPLAPILAGYVMMIDTPPSAVRAAVMSIVYFSAPLFLRRSDSLIAWAVTFLIFHVLDPAMLVNVGSLLSFTVMLGILLYIRWAEIFKSNWLATWGVTVAAWLSGVGIVAHVFERITIGGLLANVLMVPLASLAVVFGVIGAAVGCISPWLSAHFNNAAALLIQAMTGISWVVSELPYANLVVLAWPMWMCLAWYVGLLLAFWLVRSLYLHHRKLF